MLKTIFTLLFAFFLSSLFAQDSTLNNMTTEEKAALDSMLNTDEFLKLFTKDKPSDNYFQLAATVENSYFSKNNKQVNATQQENKLVFSPSIAYNHNSGISLSASGYLINYGGKTGFYQYNVTPSYNYRGRKADFAVSYTRSFRRTGYEDAASPIQNDFYVMANLKKPWLQPGISAGYSQGRSTQYNLIDTNIAIGGFTIHRVFIDTMRIKLSDFSINAFVQHDFEFYSLFNKNDGVSITPQFFLNAGSNNFSERHENPFFTRLKTKYARFKNIGNLRYDNKFQLQSVALNIDVNYVIGNLTIEPQFYIDYYLPSTQEKRLTGIRSFSVSYAF